MKKVVEYKTNLSKKELKDLMTKRAIAYAKKYEEELKNEKSH